MTRTDVQPAASLLLGAIYNLSTEAHGLSNPASRRCRASGQAMTGSINAKVVPPGNSRADGRTPLEAGLLCRGV